MRKYDYSLAKEEHLANIEKIGLALSHPVRVNILHQINDYEKTITELVKLNNVSFSSIVFHLGVLEDASLIKIFEINSKHGKTKVIQKGVMNIHISFNQRNIDFNNSLLRHYKESVRIGEYTDAEFGNNNGFSVDGVSYAFTTNSPFQSIRHNAGIIWTNKGFVEYAFDNNEFVNSNIEDIEFSFEICSELPFYNNDYKSLFELQVNGVRVCDYISLGDFGGRRGKLNPPTISNYSTQYGQLVKINITKSGVYLNGVLDNTDTTIDSFEISKHNRLKLKIINKEYEGRFGGFNLFGSSCGDYPQDIEMDVTYQIVK